MHGSGPFCRSLKPGREGFSKLQTVQATLQINLYKVGMPDMCKHQELFRRVQVEDAAGFGGRFWVEESW